MSGLTRRYGCPGIDGILAARGHAGVCAVLTDQITQEPVFVEVIEALPSIVIPNRINHFRARSFDGRTAFEGAIELKDGCFVAELTLTPLLASPLSA